MLLTLPFYLVIEILNLEGKSLIAVAFSLPSLMFVAGYMYYMMYFVSDNAPFTTVIALGEVINAIIGWPFLIFFIVKYYKLKVMNENRKQPV